MRPHIGLEITPSIRLTRALATGGMGSVWIGRHSGLDADVAVKFVSAELLSNEGALHRFADEARAAAQIKSPHVVQVHDHGVVGDDLPFIVMELLEGESLAAHVGRRGPMSIASVVPIVQQLGHALDKAHAAGIVHRDVKPDNVFLVNTYGEFFVKLIDFGIAKRLINDSSVTAAGTIVGTPDYMCPEQLLNAKDVGPSADLWSMAAVAYFALVGAAPFTRETMAATLLAVVKGELALPFERHGVGSRRLDAFFAQALARRAVVRFGSATELVAAFCEAVATPVTRTLRSEVADAGGQATTLEIAAGSGAWLSTAAVTLAGSRAPDPASSPTSSIFVRGRAPVLDASGTANVAPPDDSVRSPVTTTNAGTAEFLRHGGGGRLRPAFAVLATLASGLVAIAWLIYVRPLPDNAESTGAMRPSDVAPDSIEKVVPIASAAPAPSPAAPPLILGGTLPPLERKFPVAVGTGGEAGGTGELDAPPRQPVRARRVARTAPPARDRGF